MFCLQIHYLAHNQRSEEQPAAVPPAPPAAAAPTAMGCGPSKAHQCSAAAEMTSLLQQLAVLSAVAEDVYNPAAATGAAAAAGDARWLLTLLATKAQELVLGGLCCSVQRHLVVRCAQCAPEGFAITHHCGVLLISPCMALPLVSLLQVKC